MESFSPDLLRFVVIKPMDARKKDQTLDGDRILLVTQSGIICSHDSLIGVRILIPWHRVLELQYHKDDNRLFGG